MIHTASIITFSYAISLYCFVSIYIFYVVSYVYTVLCLQIYCPTVSIPKLSCIYILYLFSIPHSIIHSVICLYMLSHCPISLYSPVSIYCPFVQYLYTILYLYCAGVLSCNYVRCSTVSYMCWPVFVHCIIYCPTVLYHIIPALSWIYVHILSYIYIQ